MIFNRVITMLLLLLLSLNNFVFNCQHYLQIRGCTVGTKWAPSYANIFMEIYEENIPTHQSSHHPISAHFVIRQKASIFLTALFTKTQPGKMEPHYVRKKLTGKHTYIETPNIQSPSNAPFVFHKHYCNNKYAAKP